MKRLDRRIDTAITPRSRVSSHVCREVSGCREKEAAARPHGPSMCHPALYLHIAWALPSWRHF